MKSALRIGRIGPLTVNFHYIWLLMIAPGLWWLALLWLPDNVPGHGAGFYWTVALAVMLLYMVSVTLHELVHALVAGTRERNALLYPYGAAMPVTQEDMHSRPASALLSCLAGPLFNVVLGGLLLALSGTPIGGQSSVWTDALHGLATPLGWLNICLGAINFLPGIPFDGGWAIAATSNWFSGDHESGIRTGRLLGDLIIPGLALLGLWRGIADADVLPALALVVLAWMAYDGEQHGKEQSLLHGAFEELAVEEVMDPVAPPDEVGVDDSVARMVVAHSRYSPDEPLPVLDRERQLVGVVSLSAADELLQGKWTSTPVTAVMDRLPEVEALDPSAPLTEVLRMIEMRGGELSEQKPIPVIQGTHYLGSLRPSKIEGFERAELEMSEGVLENGAPVGFLSRHRWPVLVAAIAVAILAFGGSIVFNANPNNARSSAVPASQGVLFQNFSPQNGSVVNGDSPAISVEVLGARAIVTAQISLDGRYLDTYLTTDRTNDRRASAQALQAAAGTHTVSIFAVTADGRVQTAQWEFRVESEGAPNSNPGIQPQVTPTPSGGDGPTFRLPAGADQG